MGFWDRSLLICKYLGDYGPQSLRSLAQQVGLSKSSVYRLRQARERRSGCPEVEFWETETGRQWLPRLVVAMLSTFGLKRGVGMDTLSEFFVRLRLQHHLGCSPMALRGVLQALVKSTVETAQCVGAGRHDYWREPSIIGAVDETFLEHRMLVFMDLPSRYLLVEEVAARTYATWKAVVDERLKSLRATVLYLVSDRAKALIQLAETASSA